MKRHRQFAARVYDQQTASEPNMGFSRLAQMAAEHDDPVAAYRQLSPLPEDAQRIIDTAVTEVATLNLTVVADLVAAGLTTDVPDWMGVLQLDRQRTGRSGYAHVSIHPDARGERQMPGITMESFPLPITWDDWSFPARVLAASRRSGRPLDTGMISQATINVNERNEYAALYGHPDFSFNGIRLYGITNHPANGVVPLAKAWDDPTITGAEVYADVKAMIAMHISRGCYGPFNLYVPALWMVELSADYKATGDKTILERIKEFENGGRTLNVRSADMLTDSVELVQMTKNKIDLAVGTEPVPLTWGSANGWHEFGMVLSAVVPRIFEDVDGYTGIVSGQVEE